jgi:sugar O-acyltransferase (sialic acid O-acetyltransferase NeuD family)
VRETLIAIIGAGGHAKCVYECFYLQNQQVLGFFDDDRSKQGLEVIDGIRVLGSSEEIVNYSEVDAVFIAIGNNRKRLDKYSLFEGKGYLMPNAVHREVYLSPFAKMGQGNFIMGRSVINPGCQVGDCCIINTSATVGHDCVLENGVQIGPGVNLAGGSILREGVFLGIGAKVGPMVTIGAWATVGAGAVVLDDLPENSFCYGIPAKPL